METLKVISLKTQSNFSCSNQIIPCKSCQDYEDSQENAILCEKLRDSLTIMNRQLLEEVKYSDMFSITSSASQMFIKYLSTQERRSGTRLV